MSEVNPSGGFDTNSAAGAPTTRPPKKGMGCGSLLLLLVLGGVIGVGGYAAWPLWSPYVAPYVPQLEYGPDKDPRIATLVGRIRALEEGVKDRSDSEKTLDDLEKERDRLQDDVARLLTRLETLEGALDGVKQMIAATGVGEKADEAKASINRLADRLAELEAKEGEVALLEDRIGRLETVEPPAEPQEPPQANDESARLTAMLEDIRVRLAELEAEQPVARPLSTPTTEGSAAVLAMGQLRQTVMSGESFVQELESMKALAGSGPDVAAALANLRRQAGEGVATVGRLHRDFSAIAGDIVSATRKLEGEGWFEKAANRVLSLVSVRKIDADSNAASVDGIVAQAEKSLEQGDMVAAVESVERLGGVDPRAAERAAGWLKSARTQLLVERALAQLHVHTVSLIAPATN